MKLSLVDSDSDVIAALRAAFEPLPEVTVVCADILETAHTTLVSPANSAGFMDGRLDARLRRFFEPQLEDRVREAIGKRPEGHLPIGASLTVRTGIRGSRI